MLILNSILTFWQFLAHLEDFLRLKKFRPHEQSLNSSLRLKIFPIFFCVIPFLSRSDAVPQLVGMSGPYLIDKVLLLRVRVTQKMRVTFFLEK